MCLLDSQLGAVNASTDLPIYDAVEETAPKVGAVLNTIFVASGTVASLGVTKLTAGEFTNLSTNSAAI